MADSNLPDEVLKALDTSGQQLVDELKALEELPQVRLTARSIFDRAVPPGSVPQKRGILCKLLCCGKQLDVKCNALAGKQACPTHVEAAKKLRLKILAQHSSELCVQKARYAAAEEGCSLLPSDRSEAFAVMLGSQLDRQRVRVALKDADKLFHTCRANLKEAQLPVPGVTKPPPPEGEEGALHHWRRGLVGAMCDWAVGSQANVIILLTRLIKYFAVSPFVISVTLLLLAVESHSLCCNCRSKICCWRS